MAQASPVERVIKSEATLAWRTALLTRDTAVFHEDRLPGYRIRLAE